jgi:antitoxin component YwqK of YwqJK toxin-antitoxin module
MKPSITISMGLLLLTSCGVARSQPRTQAVAGPATPSAVAQTSWRDLANPTDDFASWVPSMSPPALDCPKGTTQERRTLDAGWETWCARGSVKHGPARTFEKAARRESRRMFADGALSGWSTEITIRPTVTLSGPGSFLSTDTFRGAQSVDELARISTELTEWLPSAAPPALPCPEGTSQINKVAKDQWTAECQRPDGSAHGPSRTQLRYGAEHRRVFANGAQVGPTLIIDDGRTVRDTLHEKGVMTRRVERSGAALTTFEVFRGERQLLVRFHPSGAVAQLSRFSKGARSGEWLSWHDSGALSERRTYQNGEELPGGERFDAKGTVIEVRRVKQGTGTVEQVEPGRGFEKTICEMKGGKQHGRCRTTTKGGQLVDDSTYVEGVPVARKTWWEGGGLRTDWVSDPRTGGGKQTSYTMQGRVEQVTECHGASTCTTTTFDDKGNPMPAAGGQSAQIRDEVMRALSDLL